MLSQNNSAELAIRDGVVVQRNVRHQITTPEGREVFSRFVTFTPTCDKNGFYPSRVVVILRNQDLDMFNPSPLVGRDRCVFEAEEEEEGFEAVPRPVPAGEQQQAQEA